MKRFYSNGKLLITGEYAVLDGAKALALPTTYGQSLEVSQTKSHSITWQSFNHLNTIWFEDEFTYKNNTFISLSSDQNAISQRLIQILNAAKQLQPRFLTTGCAVKTEQNFDRLWGLGTSSTLINNIANWANIDAFQLLDATFGGSGYDIACAQHDSAITYQLFSNSRTVVEVDFNPSFKDNIFFVYLNKKQNSRDSIASYETNKSELSDVISKLNAITDSIIYTKELSEFNALINHHERIISKLIIKPTVKDLYFSDFNGGIKSLGAWGGDFVLVTAVKNPKDYFATKGLNTVIAYSDMILK